MIFSLGGGGSFNPDLLNKKGTKCGTFTEKNRPTQEVQHLIISFWAGPRRIWDQKLIFYGPLYSGPFSEGRFRGGTPSDYAAAYQFIIIISSYSSLTSDFLYKCAYITTREHYYVFMFNHCINRQLFNIQIFCNEENNSH